MKRWEFTKKIMLLILEMEANGDKPVLDFVLRSAQEQKRLFDLGLSKCDGEKIKSNHQRGLAADIYLSDYNGKTLFTWNAEKARFYHDLWFKMGGKPMISWDLGHFDV